MTRGKHWRHKRPTWKVFPLGPGWNFKVKRHQIKRAPKEAQVFMTLSSSLATLEDNARVQDDEFEITIT